jgi:Protein of unknown function (DUF3224)
MRHNGLMTTSVTGTFEIIMSPQAQEESDVTRLPTARYGLEKAYRGSLVGPSIGTMISAGVPAPGNVAAYVALEEFTGSLDGRSGTFLLAHQGFLSPSGANKLSVVIVPDSGTGELVGIAGSLTIDVVDGVHQYNLEYRIAG